MKKVLLKIGFVLCSLLTCFFSVLATKMIRSGFLTFFLTFLFMIGPLGSAIALWNELYGKRSKKLLFALCIWAGIITFLFILISLGF